MSDLLLPPDALLLHVGPHKTGTTAVQSAFFVARDAMGQHGVSYPGRSRTPIYAVSALTGYGPMTGDPPLDIRNWERFVASVPRQGRVVVSSEFFADAEGEAVEQAVGDLGDERVHVVVTLRPLDRIVPSQWQQYVQNGAVTPFRRWLRRTLEADPATSGFWRRHRHDALVRRWSDVVGPDRVHVVVVDDADRAALLRTFEAMSGLPDGLLVPEADRENRSLTFPEIEIVRALNAEFRERGWDPADYRRFVRLGVTRALKGVRPDPSAPRLVLPRWAVECLREASVRTVEEIRASGVRVVGDLDSLVVAPPGPDAPEKIRKSVEVPPDLAARAAAGAIMAAQEADGPGIERAARTLARKTPGQLVSRLVRPRGRGATG
ncbi:hypothetical protein [Mumia quercus]|uniref:hypothetical protein n=1 Tax=Mumia quercus TaxID=2976125 RepID=UPI0021D3BEC3|nr:hypothetical protein [Mumia quercus]